MPDRLTVLRNRLEALGYDGLLAGWHDLDDPQRQALMENLESHDLEAVNAMSGCATRPGVTDGELCGPPWISTDSSLVGEGATLVDSAPAAVAGESLLMRGGVAVCTVAGGHGTRLGWRGPKGTYPATPVTGKSLFGCQAEQILHAQRRWGEVVPWYIMTSRENDAATRAFFTDNNCFGLRRSDIYMVPQGEVVTVDVVSRVPLLGSPISMATSPDGHGGVIGALHRAGALEDMATRGIEQISHVQIDNPLARLLDPVFLGLHLDASCSSSEFSSKMVLREDASERVGVFARIGGQVQVVEYSDLPETIGEARTESGELVLIGGNPAIHLLGREFVETLATGDPLPWHEANKTMGYFDPVLQCQVEPDAPNATKFEKFIFDGVPRAARPLLLATLRTTEFAPIKNREGADSPATSMQLQCNLYGAWLEANGVEVERDRAGDVAGRIEISPLTAMGAADLSGQSLPRAVGRGDALAL